MTQTNTGSAIGVGGGVASGLGVGGAVMSTQSRTNLAATFLPGMEPKRKFVGKTMMILFGIVLFASGISPDLEVEGVIFSIILGISLVVGGLYLLGQQENKLPSEMKLWEKKVTLFEKGWICNRCGHAWIPGQGK